MERSVACPLPGLARETIRAPLSIVLFRDNNRCIGLHYVWMYRCCHCLACGVAHTGETMGRGSRYPGAYNPGLPIFFIRSNGCRNGHIPTMELSLPLSYTPLLPDPGSGVLIFMKLNRAVSVPLIPEDKCRERHFAGEPPGSGKCTMYTAVPEWVPRW